jgi:hypothetical protein
MEELVVTKPEGWFSVASRLGDKLTDYLRESRGKKAQEPKNPTPDWESYPNARTFYTQL